MLQDALKNFYFSQFGQICKLDNTTPPSKKFKSPVVNWLGVLMNFCFLFRRNFMTPVGTE
jgi:hypothetical protein